MLKKDDILKFNLEEKLFDRNNQKLIYELLDKLYKIKETNNFMLQLPSFPKMPNLIYSKEQIYAIGGTQSIEGIVLTPEEIAEAFKKDKKQMELKIAEKSSVNLKKAHEFIIEYAKKNMDKPINERVIKQIHKYITEGIQDPSNIPGNYRNFPVEFGVSRRYSFFELERSKGWYE